MFKKHTLMAADAPTSTGGSDAKVKFAEKEYDMETGIASVSFGNGTNLDTNVDELPEAMKRQLMLHGFLQKVGDSYAGAKGNYAEGIANAQDVITALKAGEWGTGRDEGKPRLGELSAAIAAIKGIPLEQAEKVVEAADEAKRKTWRAHPKIKAAIAKARAEKAQKELEGAASAGDIEI
jgi:hypothetical protein